jgi:hypothetical protein
LVAFHFGSVISLQFYQFCVELLAEVGGLGDCGYDVLELSVGIAEVPIALLFDFRVVLMGEFSFDGVL